MKIEILKMEKNMTLKKFILRGVAVYFLASGLNVLARTPDNDMDFSHLTSDNLPHIQVIIQRALDSAVGVDGSAMKERRRIRRSFWLPYVKATGRMYYEHDGDYSGRADYESERYYLNPDRGPDYYKYEKVAYEDGEYGHWEPYFEVYAQWSFDRLFYDTDELNMARRHAYSSQSKARLIQTVRKLYVELSGLLKEKGDEILQKTDPLAFRIDVAASQLDWMTDFYLTDVVLVSQNVVQPLSGE
jgi:hypothetical protein